jgi:hypothetical protein
MEIKPEGNILLVLFKHKGQKKLSFFRIIKDTRNKIRTKIVNV